MSMNSPIAMDMSKDVNLLATKRDIKFLLTDLPSTAQFEPAVVLDIILDQTHPEISENGHYLDSDQWPENFTGEKPVIDDYDYTWMGRAKIRLLFSQTTLPKEGLSWALPLENNVSEYPLVNEIVGVVRYMNNLYYTRKINYKNFVNNNAEVAFEQTYGANMGNREEYKDGEESFVDYKGPVTKLTFNGGYGFEGALGRYFMGNPNIRSLKRFEGDTVIESRFGSSIRFGAYDDVRENDKAYDNKNNFPGYDDYKIGKGQLNNFFAGKFEVGGGNPMILLRNRQRPLRKTKPIKIHDKLPTIEPIDPEDTTHPEKNTGGYMLEDINNDGTSIHITSGCTISQFVTTCYKKMFSFDALEEVEAFCPPGATDFLYPTLNKDQLILNTDRIILSSRLSETFHFSKKRYAIVTDDEYTLDAHRQVVITTHEKTVINSPAIYLGEYNQTNEPAMLGQTTIDWMFDLCEWLRTHVHWYHHSHPDAGGADPNFTQTPVQVDELTKLEARLDKLLSRRVFLTGGGYAPGQDGVEITDGTPPVVINTITGQGVPGGYNVFDRRYRREVGSLTTQNQAPPNQFNLFQSIVDFAVRQFTLLSSGATVNTPQNTTPPPPNNTPRQQ